MSSNSAISLRGVSKIYKAYAKPVDRLKELLPWNAGKQYHREFHALSDINVEVTSGQVLGIIGQNGAGKSTLLQVICKTLTPTAGDVAVSGKIGALLELGSGFNPEFTGKENVYLSGAIAGMSRSEIELKYDEIVEFSGIGEFIHQPVRTYSSGMMVRLAFAVATSMQPEILVIDEALSVGDGAFSRKSFDRIMQLKSSGRTIIFCSHSLYQVEVLCDHVIWMDKGQIKKVGKPAEVVSEYQRFLDSLALPSDPGDVLQPVTGDHPGTVERLTARIVKVTVSSDCEESSELHLVSEKSDLRVDVTVRFDPMMATPTLGVVITDDNMRNITSTGSMYDGFTLRTPEPGIGVAELTFPKIGLRNGHYFVHVFLGCENSIHIYEAVQAASLRVTQETAEVGVVALPHIWK